MSTNSSGVKIPKRFIRLHPLDISQAQEKPDDRPADLQPRDMVRYILRMGATGCARANGLSWSDSPNDTHAVVAYKKIKLEDPWVDWGSAFARGEALEWGISGVPLALEEGNPVVQVWLRTYPSPQDDHRRATHWDWSVAGTAGGDIMRYRIVNR